MDPGVDAFDLVDRRQRVRRVREDDGEHQVERPPEARERLGAEAAVRRDRGSDERVRDLEEKGAAAAEEHDRLAIDAPDDALGGEEAVPGVDDRATARGAQAHHVLRRQLGLGAGGPHAGMVAVGAARGEPRGRGRRGNG